MTLESTVNKNRYVGNGSTRSFAFTFRAWKESQVKVFVGDGTTEQDKTNACTVSLSASGGTVTFGSAPKSGSVIVIRRNMPYVQEDDYRNGSRFDSEEIEDRLDQDCAERQDLKLDVDRAVKAPLTSSKTPEQYVKEFWDAYADMQGIAANVAAMLREVGTAIGTHSYVTADGSTVARTLGDRFADQLNAKDFGARCDGTTNDTAAINAAIAASDGQPVVIPYGAFYDRPSLVNPDNVLIIDDSTGIRVTNADYWWKPEPSSIRWLAHRGWMSGCPENTLLSFSYAAKMGAYAIETDVRFSSDSKMVLMHDATVDRTTNGSGSVSSMSFSTIRGLRADYKNGSALCDGVYSALNVPTLAEFLDICKYDAVHPMIELKQASDAQLKDINDLVKSYFLDDFVIYLTGSFHYAEVMRGLNKRAEIVTGYTTDDTATIRDYSRLGGKLALGGYLADLSQAFVNKCRTYGVDVYAFGVDSYEDYKLLMNLGVNFYIGNTLYEGDR